MINISYETRFFRMLKKLPKEIVQQLSEKTELFKKNPNDPSLRVHLLSGKMKGLYAFSVNYSIRVIFQKPKSNTILFISIGPHSAVYRE